jgi:hypothetical protein
MRCRSMAISPLGVAGAAIKLLGAADPSRSLKQPDAVTGTGLASPISTYGFARMSAIPRATADISEAGVAADNPIADMMP